MSIQANLSIFISVNFTEMEAQEHFDEFFEEVFTELEDKVQCVP